MLPFDTNILPFKTGVYVVGGSVRDLLVGRIPLDYDLVVHQDCINFASRLATTTGGHMVELGRQKQKVLRVVTKDRFFDIMPVNGTSIENDLARRDFSINAMAVDVSSGNLIDPLGGQKDLAAKKVRMVSREVFRKDPVRLIRAYRMAATFGFNIDKNTQAAIAADANLIQKSAGERIREELFKILQCTESHSYLSMMAHSDLLFSVFPEFLELRQRRMQPAGARTLFDQTLDSYNHLEKLLNPEDEFSRSIGIEALGNDDADRSLLIKWAILFHDLSGLPAKPPCANGEINNPGARANDSAARAQDICRRLRFSRRHSDTIAMIIRHHFKPIILFNAHQKNSPVEKEFIRLFLNCNDLTPDVLLHALAEFRGQREATDPVINEFTGFIRMLIQKYYTQLRPRASLPPPINGNDLINEFGMKPSAEFKHILKRVEEERLSQPTYSREEALKLVKNLLNQR
jgi:tRNA nucleotidyltransferase/poly(A) polymerase